MERRDYLELMTGQIRCKKMCPVIAKEVEDHIEDQKQAFMAEGMKEEEAEKAAVEEMGDPVEVGVEMDQIHRPKMPWKAILVIALMEILSGIFAAFFLKQSESYGYVAGIRQIFRIAMAFPVMILVCYMDYSLIGKHARLFAGGYLLFMVLMRHFFVLQINGAARWIGVGGFSVSLSLMSWLFLPLYGAVLYRYRGEGYGAVLKAVVWMLPIVGFLITCPDSVMAGTVGLSCIFMLMLALEKGWYQVAVRKVMAGLGILTVGIPAGILAYFFFFGAEYQKMRIRAMFVLDKEAGRMKGTTLGAVRELLSRCMAVGRASGVDRFWAGDRISSADYMMLGIAGYFGILVMVLCIAVIAGLLCWFLRSTLKQKNQLGMMMGFGCVMVLTIQFLLSLLANIGISGIGQCAWCLFFGYGRSGQMVSAVLMGILLSIYRHQNVTPELVVEKRAAAS